MFDARFLLTAFAVAIPLFAALLIRGSAAPKDKAVAAVLLSLLCCVGAAAITQPAGQWLALDDLSAVPAVSISALLAAILIAAPRRDLDSAACARMLVALSGILMVYASVNLSVMFVGWVLCAAPFLKPSNSTSPAGARWFARPAVALGVSIALFGIAIVPVALRGDSGSPVTVALLIIACLIRSGIFPFHSWVVGSMESDSMLPYVWLLSARTGGMVLAKLTAFAPATITASFMPLVNDLALFSSVLMAVIALGEKAPRRVLGWILVSQSGFIISGLYTANVEGVAGALTQWIAVSISAIGLALLIRCLEERYGLMMQQRFAGLGAKVPRLAVLFLLFSLALVGFPGTLSFSAEDLLFHGAFEPHPIVGIALPVATALTAIRIFILFSNIFLGRRGTTVPAVRDAFPPERWVLTFLIALLTIAGFAPQTVIDSRVQAARRIAASSLVEQTVVPGR